MKKSWTSALEHNAWRGKNTEQSLQKSSTCAENRIQIDQWKRESMKTDMDENKKNWRGWKHENMKTGMDENIKTDMDEKNKTWKLTWMKTGKHENWHGCLTTRGVEDSVPLLRSQFACSITELQMFIYSYLKKKIEMGSTIGYVLFCHLLSIILKHFELFCFSCKQINLPSPSLSALANIFWIWRKWNKKDLLLQCLEVIELIRKIKNPFKIVRKWLVIT